MAAERLSMRQIREILRQKWALKLSHRRTVRKLAPRSRRLIVVAQQAAQAVAATNPGATARARSWRNQIVAESLMIPLLVVVHHELFEHVQ